MNTDISCQLSHQSLLQMQVLDVVKAWSLSGRIGALFIVTCLGLLGVLFFLTRIHCRLRQLYSFRVSEACKYTEVGKVFLSHSFLILSKSGRWFCSLFAAEDIICYKKLPSFFSVC